MKRIVLLVVALAATGCLVLIGGGGAIASPVRPSVASAPRLPRSASAIGPVSQTTSQTGAVVLRPRDEAGLQQFIAAVTDPQSPSFHHYLARGAFASRFGPSQSTIDAVRSALEADGLSVQSVSSDGLILSFAGSATQVERTFQTGLERYQLTDGRVGQATTGAVTLPASVASAVSTVVGLDDVLSARPLSLLRAPLAAHRTRAAAVTAPLGHPASAPSPCSDAQADAQESGGLTDDQIAGAYGAFGLYGAGDLAAGQHIGIVEFEPLAPSDVRTFDACYFGSSAAGQMAKRLKVVPVDGGQPTGPGEGEASLDAEDVSAMAPGADVDVYEAPNTKYGNLDLYAAMIDNDVDQVITSSWGECEQTEQLAEPGVQQAESFLFQQAAAQGQSVFSAAGDTGSDDCNESRENEPPATQNPLSVDDPGSQPYVISVGGTTIENAATDPATERVWNDGAEWGGGGGGISMSWGMPSWQLSSRVPGIVLPGSSDYTRGNSVESQYGYKPGFCQSTLVGASSTTPCRTVPDVSAQADEFTGSVTVYSSAYDEFEPDGWVTIGGTSSATPIWAAMLAVVNASPTCQSNAATSGGVGFASPLLYAVASDRADYRASFNDITVGNNDVYGLDDGQVFPAASGYDLASGLGSPRLTGREGKAGLAFYLCSLAASGHRPAITQLSPSTLSTAGGTVTITGSGFKLGSSSSVTAITVGTWELPAGKFQVTSRTSITATFPPASDTLAPGSPAPLDGAGPEPVTVTLANGRSSATGPASTIDYVDEGASGSVPSVTSLSPTGGSQTTPGPVTIHGSDFTGATKVSFGGVAAASFHVLSDSDIQATPAPYSSSTACAPSAAGESPTTDVCQVQAVVTNAHGASATGQILLPYEGPVLPFPSAPPAGCGCEKVPAPTEFDYVPNPTVTSISTSLAEPSSLASEHGGTLITITGKGLDPMTLDWADFGDPSLASSVDSEYSYLTGTELQILAPATIVEGEAASVEPVGTQFSFKTLAGQSNSSEALYAGVPTVTGAKSLATGINAAGDTGGTPIEISGAGFAQAVGPVRFLDDVSPFSTGIQHTYTVDSDTSISTQTVSQNPSLVDVEVCSVTGCSFNPPADYFILYPPGAPKVEAVTPASGPAAGGTVVKISGQNLGCVTGVSFGGVMAEEFSNAQALLDCGSSNVVEAIAPLGKVGSKVTIKVSTVESEVTGSGPSKSSATFTYTP
jgi:hypothetical protein